MKPVNVEPRCPGCNRLLTDPAEYDNTKKQFEKRIQKVRVQFARTEKKEFDTTLRDMKKKHRTELEQLKRRLQNEEATFKAKLSQQLKGERANAKQKLEELRRNHQISLQQTRELYETQNLAAQKEREGLFNNQLREILQNYSELASNFQKEQERVRKVHDQYLIMMRKVESEVARLKLNIIRSAADPQLARLMTQIQERDAIIEDLRSKVTDLEARLLGANTMAPVKPSDSMVVSPMPGNPEPTPNLSAVNTPLSIQRADASKEKETSFNGAESNAKDINEFQKINVESPARQDEVDIDPRDLFVNAIKEINRNFKRPVQQQQKTTEQDNSDNNNTSPNEPLGKGETVATRTTTDSNSGSGKVDATKATRSRKWFM